MGCVETYRQLSADMRRISEENGFGGKIKVLAVTKTQSVQVMRQLYDAGVREFAENRIAVLEEKIPQFPDDVVWHFIGKVQSNKVRKVLKAAKVVHSVDSLELLLRIDRISGEEKVSPELYLEVNVSGEESKSGVTPQEAREILQTPLAHVRVSGLMTMAPNGASDGELKEIFSSLRRLGESLGVTEFSMGMSNDSHIAAACGSTTVRIGTALFV
ncbi:MAG: YggS family pyridoxal phosphate-dependent enzyme [Lentisphaeria bacterium]|nr:YggS family pyridoxal phosphate-dependent enzyme [Lentisphaeria bacterium]